MSTSSPVKLIKFLVQSGVAAGRRACQRLLVEDRVTVNGQITRQPSLDIDPQKDQVRLDGKLLRTTPESHPVYLMMNKPAGVLCTRKDDKGRPTVYDLLKRRDLAAAGLFTAGRLDYATTGLLFLTNDGRFSEVLTHPRYGVLKHYVAIVKGPVDPAKVRRMTRGVMDEGERLKFHKVVVMSEGQKRSALRIILDEGRNQEIRRMFRALHITLKSLTRIRIGEFTLGGLAEGSFRLLKKDLILKFISQYETPTENPKEEIP
jgi:pseudouridine synthase